MQSIKLISLPSLSRIGIALLRLLSISLLTSSLTHVFDKYKKTDKIKLLTQIKEIKGYSVT